MHQPDNLETTADSLLIQEDPGSHNQFALSNRPGSGARLGTICRLASSTP